MSQATPSEIMVVEDNLGDLQFLTRILVDEGYQVRPASDGSLALRSLKAQLPDLILLDVNLPDISGVEVCRKLKENPETSDVPVIFISAMDACDLKVRALESGGTDFVSKPFQAPEVLARIKSHLKMHRLKQDLVKQSVELKQEILDREQVEFINKRFSLMIESSVNEIYACDGKTFQFVYTNQVGMKNLGYSSEEMAELTVFDISIDITLESFSNLVGPLFLGVVPSLVLDSTHLRKDGSTYPVEVHLQIMPESPPLLMAIVLDVTQHRQQEEFLRESEDRFKAAFESTSDCVLIWNQQYDYLYANMAAIDHVGVKPEQVIGKNIRDGLGHFPDFMQLWMQRIDNVFATGEAMRVQDESSMIGRPIITDSTLSPLCNPDGSVKAVCVVYRDITQLKQTEKKLKDSQEIMENSPVVAFLWKNSKGWPVEVVSGNVSEVLGFGPAEFLSGEVAFTEFIHPEDLERVSDEVARYSADEECQGFTHEPYRLITRAGETVWVDDRTVFRRNSQGEVTHFEGIVLDITEKIEADFDRVRLENRLYQSDKMASIGQLAAGVAHEVNNPVGFISSNLKTMSDYLQELKDLVLKGSFALHASEISELIEDFEEAVSESQEGAQRVKKIVGDLTGLSRPGVDNLENADLHAGIESTLNVVWNQIKYNCTVEKEYGDIPLVECFAGQINQVFLNLLVNAGHATEEKPGLITIKTWADEEQVHISIQDNGCGIPQENLTKLFDAFYTTKEVGKGTGLGLSLSRDIVQHHGGALTVTSEVGQGTEFIVSLPIVPVKLHQAFPVA